MPFLPPFYPSRSTVFSSLFAGVQGRAAGGNERLMAIISASNYGTRSGSSDHGISGGDCRTCQAVVTAPEVVVTAPDCAREGSGGNGNLPHRVIIAAPSRWS